MKKNILWKYEVFYLSEFSIESKMCLVLIPKDAHERRLQIEQLRTIQTSFIFDFISNIYLWSRFNFWIWTKMQIVSIIYPLNLRKSNLQFLHPAGALNHVCAAIFHINCLKKSIDVAESWFAHSSGSWGVFSVHVAQWSVIIANVCEVNSVSCELTLQSELCVMWRWIWLWDQRQINRNNGHDLQPVN